MQYAGVDDFPGTSAQVTLVYIFGSADQVFSGGGRGEQFDEAQFQNVTEELKRDEIALLVLVRRD